MTKVVLDKEKFKESLSKKEYDDCVKLLSQNIKQILIEKVKEKDSSFKYTNVANLKNCCLELLDSKEKLVAMEFYKLQIEEIGIEYEVIKLMELYDRLNYNKKNP